MSRRFIVPACFFAGLLETTACGREVVEPTLPVNVVAETVAPPLADDGWPSSYLQFSYSGLTSSTVIMRPLDSTNTATCSVSGMYDGGCSLTLPCRPRYEVRIVWDSGVPEFRAILRVPETTSFVAIHGDFSEDGAGAFLVLERPSVQLAFAPTFEDARYNFEVVNVDRAAVFTVAIDAITHVDAQGRASDVPFYPMGCLVGEPDPILEPGEARLVTHGGSALDFATPGKYRFALRVRRIATPDPDWDTGPWASFEPPQQGFVVVETFRVDVEVNVAP